MESEHIIILGVILSCCALISFLAVILCFIRQRQHCHPSWKKTNIETGEQFDRVTDNDGQVLSYFQEIQGRPTGKLLGSPSSPTKELPPSADDLVRQNRNLQEQETQKCVFGTFFTIRGKLVLD